MKPEEKARIIIDRQLEEAGWQVVDRDEYTSMAHACAVREGLMNLSGSNLEADYLLFIEGKAVGVVEAKREENELGDDVKLQALQAQLEELQSQIEELESEEGYEDTKEYKEAKKQEKQQKADIKNAIRKLTDEVVAKYKALAEDEIRSLVVNDKWLTTLQNRMESEMTRVSQEMTTTVLDLQHRYAKTLPEIEQSVSDAEAAVKEYLQQMGF